MMINSYSAGYELQEKGIPLGKNLATGEEVFLDLDLLKTHLHVIGPTGTGKTRFLLHLSKYLMQIPRATFIQIDFKGDLHELTRDYCISAGLAKRLVIFDPQNQEAVCGYNPLRPNGLPLGTHAKAVREGIEAAWGQNALDFAMTPQLHRFLYLTLYAVRELELTLVEALELLRPGSEVRKAIIPRIRDPYVKSALVYFDSLQERRQEEIAASSVARLEGFCLDRHIRQIFAPQQRSLDLAAVMRNHQILLVNLGKGRAALRRDDASLLGKLIVNDVVNHAFEREPQRRTPCYLMSDEFQNAATPDFASCLDEGRGLETHCVLSHQFLAQIQQEERSGYLYHSVMNDCRTRVCFGGSAPEDLEVLVPRMFLGELNPWALKDELVAPVFAPVESTRVVRTTQRGRSRIESISYPYTEGESESESEGEGTSVGTTRSREETVSQAHTHEKSRGRFQAWGASDTTSDAWSESDMKSNHISDTEGEGNGYAGQSGSNFSYGSRGNWAIGWQGGSSWHQESSRASMRGTSDGHASTVGGGNAHTDSANWGEQEGESDGVTRGRSSAVGEAETVSFQKNASRTRGTTITRGETPSLSEGESGSESESVVPFHEYHERSIISSRTFLSLEEQKLLLAQKLEAQPQAHCVIKAPGEQALFLKLPQIETPWISGRRRERAVKRIWTSQPYYSTPAEIEAEAEARRRLLLTHAPVQEAEIIPDQEAVEPATYRHKRKKA